MSAILGIFPAVGAPPVEAVSLQRMLARMVRRGADQAACWHEGGSDGHAGVALAAARYDWELGAGFAGPVLVVQEGALAIAADAALYYRDDLRRKLAVQGIRPSGQTPSHLILAAYRAWGERCAEHLEGDFAFVLHDRQQRRVVAARDFGGRRPLHFATLADGTLVVASTVGGVLAHPRCPQDVDLARVLEAAAAFVGARTTAYSAIQRLEAGETLVRSSGRREPLIARHWEPPTFESGSSLPFDEAAEQLREVLTRAVRERMAPRGTTTVWMSGGRDSTAVFAVGADQLRRTPDCGQLLQPVSMSYPVGDRGREDERIQEIAERWQVPIQWVDIRDVPLFDRPAERAVVRDEPFAHLYEMVNRSLARASASCDAHVALDGIGGDQLFQVSNVFLADLLRRGQWRGLRQEWHARGLSGSGARTFLRWAVQPALPPALRRALELARRRPLRAELRRRVPLWARREFLRDAGVGEFHDANPPRRGGESASSVESRWYLSDPYFPAVFGTIAEFALEEGVETRSPLMDGRVIALAATRPREERVAGTDTKRLLRAAVRDLLPESVTAPRAYRAGVTIDYLDQSLRERFASYVQHELAHSQLAAAGAIDAVALRRACNVYLRTGDQEIGLRLFMTLQADLWLRSHASAPDVGIPATEPVVQRLDRGAALVPDEVSVSRRSLAS